MCGIAGILSQQPIDKTILRRMLATMAHRGPDDEGTFNLQLSTFNLHLGMRRLAIIDLSGGHQPMFNEDGTLAIVFNGEIYNFMDLRAELERRSHRFRTRSDTEVILHAYEEWGPACVHRLRGMFAFAIYDRRPQPSAQPSSPISNLQSPTPHLFLARDRFGIKPLYYYATDGLFVFASEVRALLASGLVPRRLDRVGLWHYLAYQSVPAPRTLVEGVRMLLPGHRMTVDATGQVRVEKYWDLWDRVSERVPSGLLDEQDVKRQVRDLVLESVSLRLISDVPVGIFLSGGIDSSAVVAAVHEVGHRPRTFSVVFRELAYDEAPFSRTVARRFGAEHTEILLDERELLELLPQATAAMDHPSGDGINTYVVSYAVHRAGFKVALSGLGGDEVFAGYPTFRWLTHPFLRLGWKVPLGIRRGVAQALRRLIPDDVRLEKALALWTSDGSPAAAYPVLRRLFTDTMRARVLSPAWVVADRDDPYVPLLAEALDGWDANGRGDEHLLAAISYAEARTYMHDVLLRDTDQMSMAHSLEVRVPLLDHRLAEYVVALPDRFKVAPGMPKRLLVESLDVLPAEIVRRPKQGFVLPFAVWMRGALRPFCEKRLKRLGERGIFRPDALQALWDAFLAGKRSVTWSRLWALVVLEEWMERQEVETTVA